MADPRRGCARCGCATCDLGGYVGCGGFEAVVLPVAEPAALRRIIQASGASADLSDAEFAAVRDLLEQRSTWEELLGGRGTVEELAIRIASCLPGRAAGVSVANGWVIAWALLDYAVRDLDPRSFRSLLVARLDRMEARLASALEQAVLGMHVDLAAQLAASDRADADRWAHVLDQLPAGPADRGEVSVYLATLHRWLNTDPWPQGDWFSGPALTPVAIERKLRIAGSRSARGEDMDADDLARRCARLVVLGGPGSGKTWLAKRTARLCAKTALDALAAGASLDEIELPLYTTCAELSKIPAGVHIRRAVVASALGQLPDMGGQPVSDALQTLFERRDAPTLLVADSLDEAYGADTRIGGIDNKWPAAWRVVLTTRPGSWHRQLPMAEDDPSHEVGDLQPLRYPEDVEPFIGCWFGGQPARATELAAQLRDRPALQQAATVPLILAFFCIVGGSRRLPARRADLYDEVIRCMLTGRWRGGRDLDPDPDACVQALRYWAWSAAAKHEVSHTGAWEDGFLAPRIKQSAQLTQDDQDALDHVAVPLGRPEPKRGGRQRRFAHRSLREHLVAEHVALQMTFDQSAEELLNHLWYDPDWEYAAPAAIAISPHRGRLLRVLIHRAAKSESMPDDLSAIDASWEFRRLLARIAANSNEADWPTELAGLISQARADLAGHGDTSELAEADSWAASSRRSRDALLRRLTASIGKPAIRTIDLHLDIGSITINEKADSHILDAVRVAATESGQAAGEAKKTVCEYVYRELRRTVSEGLVDSVVQLGMLAGDKRGTLESLLRLLVSQNSINAAAELVHGIALLDPAAEDRRQALNVLFDLLRREADIDPFEQLYPLIPEAEREKLGWEEEVRITKLGGLIGHEGAVADAARAIALLEPTVDDMRVARGLILELVPRHPALPGHFVPWLQALAPTPEETIDIREKLLSMAASRDDLGVTWIANLLNQFDPADEDKRRIRSILLRLLAQEPEAGLTAQLADTLADFTPSPENAQTARGCLLEVLSRDLRTPEADNLAAALARLAPSAQDKTEIQTALSRLLGPDRAMKLLAGALSEPDATTEDSPAATEPSKKSAPAPDTSASDPSRKVTQPNPEQEQHQARNHILRKLDNVCSRHEHPETYYSGMDMADEITEMASLVAQLARLNPGEMDARQTRDALLKCIDYWAGSCDQNTWDEHNFADLVSAFVLLASTPEGKPWARQGLLELLDVESDPEPAANIGNELAVLGPTEIEKRKAKNALLELLDCEYVSAQADALVNAIIQLDPTPEDKGRARGRLLGFLFSGSDSTENEHLVHAMSQLDPSVPDIINHPEWHRNATRELLAAVRRNSTRADWLALLPSLSMLST